jgi:NADH dehydrogenase
MSSPFDDATRPQVVIVGGGFGGLYAAKHLRKAPVNVTVIDRRNFHLFQPLLYQVATGALSPGEIASPLRAVLSGSKNVRVWLADVTGLDPANREVMLSDGGEPARYDTLVLATGSHHHYFGHDAWEKLAPGLKTVEDATAIRTRILRAFECAERARDPQTRRDWLTFVIVGGGPTGLELAGALGEIATDTLRRDFHQIDPADAQILLVEASDRVLNHMAPDLSKAAEEALIRLGVRALTSARVTNITPDGVEVSFGQRSEFIRSHTVVWAAGVQASPLGKMLGAKVGAQTDRAGRVIVEPDLTIAGHPEIFVIGDMANFSHQTGKPLPGVAPVAMQQGRYVARLIRARAVGKTLPPFHYFDKGTLATIGRAEAVAEFGKLHFSGFLAWLVWLFVHLMNLVEFDNRLLVLIEWTYNYITRNRGARLITGDAAAGGSPAAARQGSA